MHQIAASSGVSQQMMSELEIRRRIFHLIGGLLIALLIYLDVLNASIALIVFVAALFFGLIMKKVKIPLLRWVFEKIDRPKDYKKLPGKGLIFFMLGVFIVLAFFDKDVAIAGVLILAVGDSIAAIIGQYGEIPNPFDKKKYIEGSIGGAIVAGLAAALIVSPVEAALASAAAMIAEGAGLRAGRNQIDDNIIMPIIAGLTIWILRTAL